MRAVNMAYAAGMGVAFAASINMGLTVGRAISGVRAQLTLYGTTGVAVAASQHDQLTMRTRASAWKPRRRSKTPS